MNYLWRHIIVILFTTICASLAFVACLSWYGHWYRHYTGADRGVSDGVCNIAVVPIQGDIISFDDPNAPQYGGGNTPSSSGDYFARYVRHAEQDPNILGVLVPIDSGGGEPAASEVMMNVLKRSRLPSVALIRSMGASGAYMAALGASHVIASQISDVGSIGVTYSYLNESTKNTRDGIDFVQISSGQYKDMGNPDKPITDAERQLYERDLLIYKELFVSIVAESRHLSTTTVEALATGETWPGSLALQNGLIDQLGDEETAKAWFAEKLGLSPDDVVMCE